MVACYPFLSASDSVDCDVSLQQVVNSGGLTLGRTEKTNPERPGEETSHRNVCEDVSDSDEDWDEIVPETALQVPPAEMFVAQPDFSDKPAWDIVVAPGEGISPCSVFADCNTMAKAFPTVFGGYAVPDLNQLSISWSKFSKWLLGHRDRNVALTIEAIFFLFKMVQISQLKRSIQVAMRNGNTKGKVPVGQLMSSSGLEAFVKNDDGYRVLSRIRGSPSYWLNVQKEIFAMVRQLGKPTFFLSFSAAETKWPFLLQSLASTVDGSSLTAEEVLSLPWESKCRLIRSDPDTCVRYFESRYRAFMNVYLPRGKTGALGTVDDYVYRVEFQQRGSPHIHSLWWIAGAPKRDIDEDKDVVNFVDRFVTCAAHVDDTIPVTYQMHRHAKTCKIYRAGRRACRFGFPKPPMRQTCILRLLPPEEATHHEANRKKVEAVLSEFWKESPALSFDDFLEMIGLTEAEYILAVRSSTVRTEIFLRRSTTEIRINAYNAELLPAWDANMDIQYAVNAYAVARYIVSYMLKSQRGISYTMRNVLKEVKCGNFGLWSKLRKVSNAFLNCVEISEQECIWMLRQFPLYKCSRDVIFVNASLLIDRVVLLKPIAELRRLKANDAESCDVECDNIIKRYQRRPGSMKEMSLANFAAWYDCDKPSAAKPYDDFEDVHENSDTFPEAASLACEADDDAANINKADAEDDAANSHNIGPALAPFDRDQILKRRRYAKVLRSPRFWQQKDKEKHYFEKLMLYQPWRAEDIDLCPGEFGTLQAKWMDAIKRNPAILRDMQRFDRMGASLDSVIEDVLKDLSGADDPGGRSKAISNATVAGNVQHLDEIDEAAAHAATGDEDDDAVHQAADLLADAGLRATSTELELPHG